MLSFVYFGIILNAALIHGCIHEGPRAYEGSRIIGGDDMEIKDVPYLVSINVKIKIQENWTYHSCGGTLVSVNGIQVVISAASCFGTVGEILTDIYGAGDEQRRHHKHLLLPEGYGQDAALGNDIALLLLNKDFELSDELGFAELPSKDFVLAVGEKLLVTGTGFDINANRKLRGIILPVISNEECEQLFEDLKGQLQIRKEHFFCMYSEGKDFCTHDEGGPAVTTRGGPPILAGVISWNKGCAELNRPSLYTRVAEFTDWIEQKVAQVQQSYYPWDGYEY